MKRSSTTSFSFRIARYVSCCAACGIIAMTLTSCKRAVSADVAATVNGRSITYSDIDRALATQVPVNQLNSNDDQVKDLRLDTLRSLIDDEIMLQKAEKGGLTASDSDVDAKFNELKAPYTEDQFKKQLAARKMTPNDLKAKVRRDLSISKLINKEIGSHITITDAEVTAFYNKNKASFNLAEPQIHLAQILVTSTPDPGVQNMRNDKAQTDDQAKSKINMLENRLRQGEDFGMLAQSYSEDAKTAPNGGDLGMVPESALDQTNPDLRKLILSMNPGQISGVIHTPDGYRILKVVSKEPAGQRDLSDPRVQETIRVGLFNKKDQLLRDAFYEDARCEAKVVNYLARSILATRDKK